LLIKTLIFQVLQKICIAQSRLILVGYLKKLTFSKQIIEQINKVLMQILKKLQMTEDPLLGTPYNIP